MRFFSVHIKSRDIGRDKTIVQVSKYYNIVVGKLSDEYIKRISFGAYISIF